MIKRLTHKFPANSWRVNVRGTFETTHRSNALMCPCNVFFLLPSIQRRISSGVGLTIVSNSRASPFCALLIVNISVGLAWKAGDFSSHIIAICVRNCDCRFPLYLWTSIPGKSPLFNAVKDARPSSIHIEVAAAYNASLVKVNGRYVSKIHNTR